MKYSNHNAHTHTHGGALWCGHKTLCGGHGQREGSESIELGPKDYDNTVPSCK